MVGSAKARTKKIGAGLTRYDVTFRDCFNGPMNG